MTLYEMISYFFIYSFMGWGGEVICHVLRNGTIVNRGYLNGPICPIYGFGMLAILILLRPVSDKKLALFFGGMFLATSVELIGGWLLYHFFKMRWWDYSNEPFNLGGFICARYAVLWGIGTVVVINMVHPVVETFVRGFPHNLGIGFLVTACTTCIFDSLATTLTVLNMIEKFARLDRLALSIREYSDFLTKRIGARALKVEGFADEKRLDAALAKAELKDRAQAIKGRVENKIEGLKSGPIGDVEQKIIEAEREYILRLDEYKKEHSQLIRELKSHSLFGSGRILKAFPHLEERFKHK